MIGLRIPASTYRLQFHAGFRFEDAKKLVPYLHKLGVTDVYASPLLKARKGSVHGYDVVDHSQLNPEIGTEEEFNAFSDELLARDMGLVVDVVPNHMEIDDPENKWWQDVLENGPSSPFAKFFDIDWNPPKTDLRNRVLLPVLGSQYGDVLESGQLKLMYEKGAFHVAYYERRYPLDPKTWVMILDSAVEHVRYIAEPNDPERILLESIVTALATCRPARKPIRKRSRSDSGRKRLPSSGWRI
jgi:(1->4)-alpha-D-glucan 1-alpha-D-glucosylmutase